MKLTEALRTRPLCRSVAMIIVANGCSSSSLQFDSSKLVKGGWGGRHKVTSGYVVRITFFRPIIPRIYDQPRVSWQLIPNLSGFCVHPINFKKPPHARAVSPLYFSSPWSLLFNVYAAKRSLWQRLRWRIADECSVCWSSTATLDARCATCPRVGAHPFFWKESPTHPSFLVLKSFNRSKHVTEHF